MKVKIFRCVLYYILFVASIFEGITAMYSSKALEGYPAGYLSDCPNKTQPLTKEELKHIYLIVHGTRSPKKIKYNYYQTGLMAKNPHMDWSKKILLYVGGYLSTPIFLDATVLEYHYIQLGYNVWLLDEFYFTLGLYPNVARKVRHVGAHVGEMLAELTNAGVLDPSKLEVVGLSLGGQTMSYIAKKYHKLTGRKISRLTGLDPAGPCFRNSGPEDRLDDTDAEFVDVVLTNIDGYGMAAPVGHVNFYVNGGEYQLADVTFVIPCTVFCSHARSYMLYLSALAHQDSFIGIKCDSVQDARFKKCFNKVPQVTNIMGPKADRSKPGIYYLSTTNTYPYFMGKNGLRKENDNAKVLLKYLLRDWH